MSKVVFYLNLLPIGWSQWRHIQHGIDFVNSLNFCQTVMRPTHFLSDQKTNEKTNGALQCNIRLKTTLSIDRRQQKFSLWTQIDILQPSRCLTGLSSIYANRRAFWNWKDEKSFPRLRKFALDAPQFTLFHARIFRLQDIIQGKVQVVRTRGGNYGKLTAWRLCQSSVHQSIPIIGDGLCK